MATEIKTVCALSDLAAEAMEHPRLSEAHQSGEAWTEEQKKDRAATKALLYMISTGFLFYNQDGTDETGTQLAICADTGSVVVPASMMSPAKPGFVKKPRVMGAGRFLARYLCDPIVIDEYWSNSHHREALADYRTGPNRERLIALVAERLGTQAALHVGRSGIPEGISLSLEYGQAAADVLATIPYLDQHDGTFTGLASCMTGMKPYLGTFLKKQGESGPVRLVTLRLVGVQNRDYEGDDYRDDVGAEDEGCIVARALLWRVRGVPTELIKSSREVLFGPSPLKDDEGFFLDRIYAMNRLPGGHGSGGHLQPALLRWADNKGVVGTYHKSGLPKGAYADVLFARHMPYLDTLYCGDVPPGVEDHEGREGRPVRLYHPDKAPEGAARRFSFRYTGGNFETYRVLRCAHCGAPCDESFAAVSGGYYCHTCVTNEHVVFVPGYYHRGMHYGGGYVRRTEGVMQCESGEWVMDASHLCTLTMGACAGQSGFHPHGVVSDDFGGVALSGEAATQRLLGRGGMVEQARVLGPRNNHSAMEHPHFGMLVRAVYGENTYREIAGLARMEDVRPGAPGWRGGYHYAVLETAETATDQTGHTAAAPATGRRRRTVAPATGAPPTRYGWVATGPANDAMMREYHRAYMDAFMRATLNPLTPPETPEATEVAAGYDTDDGDDAGF